MGQAWPVGDLGVEIVKVGDMDLPVLRDDCARRVSATDPHLCFIEARADLFRTFADTYDLGPADPVGVGDPDGGTRRAKQARAGFGDLVQRAFGIARGAGDGAEDFGGGVLAILGGAQLGP